MRHIRIHLILWVVVAVTTMPNVGMAQRRSSFKGKGSAGLSRSFKKSTSVNNSKMSGPRRRTLPSSGSKSMQASGFKKISSQRATPKTNIQHRLQNRGIASGMLPHKSHIGQGGPRVNQSLKKQAIASGKARRLDAFKSVKSDITRRDRRIGDLSKLKDLKQVDLSRARQAGLIQGSGSVQGLKKLASRIQDRKIASGNLQKLDKHQLANIVKFGRASTTAAHRHAAIAAAKKHCGLHTKCHWWFDVICGMHWKHHGCHWDYWCYPVYWKCWTPCRWHVVYCPTIQISYYFGVEGVVIPDTAAFGIQVVQPGSPAERAGLRPGMMIVAVNGQAMTSDAVMAGAIQQSGGRLDLEVLAEGSDQPVPVTVMLSVIRRSAY